MYTHFILHFLSLCRVIYNKIKVCYCSLFVTDRVRTLNVWHRLLIRRNWLAEASLSEDSMCLSFSSSLTSILLFKIAQSIVH